MNFLPIPKCKVISGKTVKYNNVTVILGEKGAIYTNCEPVNRHAFCCGAFSWSIDLFEALKMLGLISKEAGEAHSVYLAKVTEQDRITSWMYEIKNQHDGRNGLHNPAIKVDVDMWNELWNKLDYYNQKKMEKHKPDGARMKRVPKAVAGFLE